MFGIKKSTNNVMVRFFHRKPNVCCSNPCQVPAGSSNPDDKIGVGSQTVNVCITVCRIEFGFG
jgi:hypothetical protein